MIGEYDLDFDVAVELFNEEYFNGILTYKQLATIEYYLVENQFIGRLFFLLKNYYRWNRFKQQVSNIKGKKKHSKRSVFNRQFFIM